MKTGSKFSLLPSCWIHVISQIDVFIKQIEKVFEELQCIKMKTCDIKIEMMDRSIKIFQMADILVHKLLCVHAQQFHECVVCNELLQVQLVLWAKAEIAFTKYFFCYTKQKRNIFFQK